ncbi:MAG: 50S ribosomal protein L28 [Bacteroidales bacterium]|nr:50S ribosomal protein L28 [Bacteroidales bacterium]
MSRVCQITGKSVMSGNNVSHSHKKTRRKWYPNLLNKKFYLEQENRWITLKISANGLRLINKIGLENALSRAVKNGHLSKY